MLLENYTNLGLTLMQVENPLQKRVAEIAAHAKSMITGRDQSAVLEKYRRLEDDDLKKQRERLTNSLTKYVLSRPRKYWKKIGRVSGINFRKEGDAAKIADIDAQFERFYNRQNLTEYLIERLEFLGVTDPNAWIIFERGEQRAADGTLQRIWIYPVEVPSANVLHAKDGEYLLYFSERPVTFANGVKEMVFDYYLYGKGIAIKYQNLKGAKPTEYDRIEKVSFGGKVSTFGIIAIETGTGVLNAMCAGVYRDEITDQAFVTWFDPAEQVLYDLIRDKSYLDVTKSVHVYPKRYEYVKKCGFRQEESVCVRGFMDGNLEARCPSCNGTGESQVFNTEQKAVKLVMPERAEELLELGKLYHYEGLPMELPQWLSEQVELAEKRVLSAVFNAGILDRASGVIEKTATQTEFEYEDLNDVLLPFANKISQFIELAYSVMANMLEMTDFHFDHRFPKDLKLQYLGTVIQNYLSLKNGGAGYEIVKEARAQVLAKLNEDNEVELSKINAKYKWLPFDDRTETEISAILAARSAKDFDRVLYENWKAIFLEINNAHPDFYRYEHAKQKAVIEEWVNIFSEKVQMAGGDSEPLQIEIPIDGDI